MFAVFVPGEAQLVDAHIFDGGDTTLLAHVVSLLSSHAFCIWSYMPRACIDWLFPGSFLNAVPRALPDIQQEQKHCHRQPGSLVQT